MEYVNLAEIKSLDDIDKLAIDLAFNYAENHEKY